MTDASAEKSKSRLAKLLHKFTRTLSDGKFLLTVFMPTLIAAIYFGTVASDVYISESRFVVRSPQRQVATGLGALLQGTGLSRSQDDTYSVHDYVLSRDALRAIDAQVKFREAFTSGDIDIFNRFAGIGWDESFEALHKYYQKHVVIDYDTVSSITTLKVRAFTAEQALAINELLLQTGEKLLNNLNARSRQDLIQVAQLEVSNAEERAKDAAVALSSFRGSRAIFDPDRQSAQQLLGVSKIQEELLATETQIAQLKRVAPDNSQIAALQQRANLLRQAMANETAKVAGGEKSLTSKSPAYERLVLEREFANKQLGTSLAALETARNEANRKQLYLERLVQPNLPDDAVEPRRFRSVVMIFVLGLIVWGVVSLVVASIREHTD
ncbi:MAG: hypothetical protein V4650_03395 [Pseudomonadota bacterium]